MASYPFLYAAAASVLPKLDPSMLKSNFELPAHMKKDVMEWKEILSNLPSFIETLEFSKEGIIAISNFVFDFHIKKQEKDWKSLVGYMTEFTDHYYSKTKKPIILQSSLSSSLHKSKQPIEDSSSGVNLEYEFDTRTSPLLSSLTRALSSLKAPDVKPLDDLPPLLLPCLAYCALYPQGSTFVRETLIYQWVAEGFLLGDWPRESSVGEQVERGNLYFNMLLEKGVFVEPIFRSSNSSGAYKRIHSCKMHPDIHSAVCGMASNEVLIIPDTKQGSAAAVTTKYIALHKEDNNNNEFPLRPTTWLYFLPEIKKGKVTLQRNAEIQSYEFPLQPTTFMCFIPEINKVNMESLLRKFGELRVLYFAGTQFKELPTEFTAFTKLRCLALSRNTLLKRLDCSKYSRLPTLAVDECVNLEKVNAARSIEILQLSHCPELKLFTVPSYSILEILHIFACPRLESLPKEGSYKLKELVCHNCDSLDLDLGECWGYLNYVEVVGLPKLIELKLGNNETQSLLIANCSNLKSIDNHLQESIDSLETLRIYDCPNLEISPKVLSSLIKLRSIEVRNCPIIMTTTFSNDAMEELVPWIWSKDPDFIIDGQRHSTQEVGLLEEVDAALGPLGKSSGAQTSSYVTFESSYFKMVSESSKSTEDSKGIFDQEFRRKMFFTSINEIRKEHKIYCCLFPGDVEFERDTFVRLWMALGIFQEPLEFSGEECFEGLMNEGFIIDSRTDILTGTKKYKINVDNDKVKTFSNRVDNKDLYARLEDDQMAAVNTLSLSKCRHVSLVGQKINEEIFKTLEGISELRTVLLIWDYGDSLKHIPSSFFEALTCMRALDLSGSHISELPSSIGNMLHLRFLDLSFTLLERIPESIAGLGELQTLKLKGCKHLHTLPKGMKQLRSLRHLDFDILGQLTSMPEGMGQLTELRTLTAFIVSEEDGCTIRELGNLNNLNGSFCISGLEYASEDDVEEADMQRKSLTGLHLKWNDSVSYGYDARLEACQVLNILRPCHLFLEELKISNYPGSFLTMWGNGKQYRNFVRLELINCKNKSFEVSETLPNLKYLNITDMDGVKRIDGLNQPKRPDREIRFPKLETLIIDGMLNLESWPNIEEGEFPHLTKLSLMHCPKLTQLDDDFLSILHSLTYLEISHCKSFASLSSKPLPTSLETLIINKCPALKNHAPIIQDVPNIWIDMKGLGSANQDTDSDDSDYSEDETDHFNDSD